MPYIDFHNQMHGCEYNEIAIYITLIMSAKSGR